MKMCFYLDAHHLGLKKLDHYYFLGGFFDVEIVAIFSEFPCFYLTDI